MLFDGIASLARVVGVSLAAYAALILLLRVAGKRSLAKLNAFDFVVTVALGSTLATVLLSEEVALVDGVTALAMLLLLQWLVSRLSISSHGVRRLVRSDPRLLFENGEFREEAMADERVTHSEIEAAIRTHGYGDLADVTAVVLETDGSLSVIAGEKPKALSALRSVRR